MAKKKTESEFNIPVELQGPIPWTGPKPSVAVQNLLESDEAFAERKASVDAQCKVAHDEAALVAMRRLILLAKHMGVEMHDEGWPLRFCIVLAMALCPKGFSVQFTDTAVGRPKIWNEERYMELIADVESVKSKKSCNDTAACRSLIQRAIKAKSGRYLPPAKSTLDEAAATLANRLGEARNEKYNFWAKVLQLSNPSDQVDQAAYSKLVRDVIARVFESPERVRP